MKHSENAWATPTVFFSRADFFGQRSYAEIMQFGFRFGSILHAASLRETARQHFEQFRKRFVVTAAATLRLSPKTRHSLRDVGLKADTLLLAVIADIDSGFFLFFDDMTNSGVHRCAKLSWIDSLSLFAADEQLRELIIARQASHMSHQDSIAASNHREPVNLRIGGISTLSGKFGDKNSGDSLRIFSPVPRRQLKRL